MKFIEVGERIVKLDLRLVNFISKKKRKEDLILMIENAPGSQFSISTKKLFTVYERDSE